MVAAFRMARALRGKTSPHPHAAHVIVGDACYLTLETDADFDVKTIYVALPDPALKGSIIKKWQGAGIEVHVGLMAREAYHEYRGHITRTLLQRPYITMMSKPQSAESEKRGRLQRAKVDLVINEPHDIAALFEKGYGHVLAEGIDMPIIDEALLINATHPTLTLRNTDRIGPDTWNIYDSPESLALERDYFSALKPA